MDELEILKNKIANLEQIVMKGNFISLQVFDKAVQFNSDVTVKDGRNVKMSSIIGSSIGSSTSKISVYGVTPVVQASAISSPSGGATVDSQSRTAINTIITVLKNFGITL